MFRCSVTFQGWFKMFFLYHGGKFLIWVICLLLTFLTKLFFQVWVWKIEEEGKSWKWESPCAGQNWDQIFYPEKCRQWLLLKARTWPVTHLVRSCISWLDWVFNFILGTDHLVAKLRSSNKVKFPCGINSDTVDYCKVSYTRTD